MKEIPHAMSGIASTADATWTRIGDWAKISRDRSNSPSTQGPHSSAHKRPASDSEYLPPKRHKTPKKAKVASSDDLESTSLAQNGQIDKLKAFYEKGKELEEQLMNDPLSDEAPRLLSRFQRVLDSLKQPQRMTEFRHTFDGFVDALKNPFLSSSLPSIQTWMRYMLTRKLPITPQESQSPAMISALQDVNLVIESFKALERSSSPQSVERMNAFLSRARELGLANHPDVIRRKVLFEKRRELLSTDHPIYQKAYDALKNPMFANSMTDLHEYTNLLRQYGLDNRANQLESFYEKAIEKEFQNSIYAF